MIRVLVIATKLLFISILVLVLGNKLEWDGKTISDQVKIQMAQAERSDTFQRFQNWLKSLVDTAKEKVGLSQEHTQKFNEKLLNSERQKLNNLLKDLNSSYYREK